MYFFETKLVIKEMVIDFLERQWINSCGEGRDQWIIIRTQIGKYITDHFTINKGLSNGNQGISITFHFLKIGRDRKSSFLNRSKIEL